MDKNCHVEPIQKIATAEEQQTTDWIVFGVRGLGCVNCAARVRNGLIGLQGVTEAMVDHVMATATVKFNPNLVTLADLFKAVARAGNDGHHEYRAYSLM
jgi:Cu+-exporting ATPase